MNIRIKQHMLHNLRLNIHFLIYQYNNHNYKLVGGNTEENTDNISYRINFVLRQWNEYLYIFVIRDI